MLTSSVKFVNMHGMIIGNGRSRSR